MSMYQVYNQYYSRIWVIIELKYQLVVLPILERKTSSILYHIIFMAMYKLCLIRWSLMFGKIGLLTDHWNLMKNWLDVIVKLGHPGL